MVKFGWKPVFRKVSVPFNIIISCSLLLLVSCQTMQPSGSPEITNLANELEEANQKLEEIYHRVQNEDMTQLLESRKVERIFCRYKLAKW